MQPGRDRPTAPPPDAGRAFCVRPTLGRKQRLRRTAAFDEAYAQNQRWHGRHMVLFRRAAPDASCRLGVVASRKVGNAVERARAKRRLREAFRLNRHRLTGADDIILVARRSILAAPWPAVVEDLLALAAKANLLPPP
ncbi:MAG TPA: ribonuclease P protein component [Kiritimatiellia bacterium]|jgi:ribonuclease P protein component|nr:ribonuclease P protein component [Kiritimatiellia bacterium]OQC54034.1 MAG: Ribonuclease P protein component [Verrucomicrobia bacterium ADurb.Bin018]HOD99745.1 ribonuclease P protein component [Kiritimatiellia bacterium]HOE36185.1 ribonuclease P protein component [Kiritimatiellia bacterium]HOR73819.1 ribonuclease P protein component [Kiritimatiellia bacterium]